MGKRKFGPLVDLKPLKILKPKLDSMIMSWTPTTLPIFVEIGPTRSAPHIAETQPTCDFVYLSFPFLSFLPRDASAERGYEIACRLSVSLSVRDV